MQQERRLDEHAQVYDLCDESATAQLAVAVASHIAVGDLFALNGQLGAGKTTFVRALCEALDGDPMKVASPTYTLMHVYQTSPPLVHIDAYRLIDGEDLEALGLSEMMDESCACIEWAARIEDLEHRCQRLWELTFEHRDHGRAVHVITPDPAFHWEHSS